MAKIEFEQRTLQFSRRIVALVNDMGENRIGACIRNQLLRSGTSIGADYREAQCAESRKDFGHKIEIATKEAAPPVFAIAPVGEDCRAIARVQRTTAGADLLEESRELLAILTTIGRKIKYGK